MVQNLSIPNYHEDQPSQLENTLSSSIAGHNPLGAAYMLMAEQNRRGQTQDDYHSYMAGVNALQRQNMAAQQSELVAKTIGDAGNNKNSQIFNLLRANPQTAGLLGGVDTDAATRDITQRNAASMLGDSGKGIGSMAGAGIQMTPGYLGSMLPNADGSPSTVVQGPAPMVQAAGINAAAHIAGAKIGAASGNKSYTETVTVDEAHPFNTTKTHSVGPANTGAPHGISSVVPPVAGSVVNGASTVAPPTDQVNARLSALHSTNSAGHADVIKAIANNGGKPIIGERPDGKRGLVGASGQVY